MPADVVILWGANMDTFPASGLREKTLGHLGLGGGGVLHRQPVRRVTSTSRSHFIVIDRQDPMRLGGLLSYTRGLVITIPYPCCLPTRSTLCVPE
jgi:hypothetical protein